MTQSGHSRRNRLAGSILPASFYRYAEMLSV